MPAVMEKAKEHTPAEDDKLTQLATANTLTTWKDIAWFTYGTDVPAEVNRSLFETIGIKKHNAVDPGVTVLKPAAGLTGKLRIPKPVKRPNLAIKKKHTLTLKKITPPNSIGFTKLDRWFIPKKETCRMKYLLSGVDTFADRVSLAVFGSNYSKSTAWNKGLGTYAKIVDVPVYTRADGTPKADQRTEHSLSNWDGAANATDGVLKPVKGIDPFVNVAFSPYTVNLRYSKADNDSTDKDAKILIDAFWPEFDATPPNDVKQPSLKMKWEVKGTTRLKEGSLLVVDKDNKVVYRKPLIPGDVGQGTHSFDTWDGVYNWKHDTDEPLDAPGATDKVKLADMPYRVEIRAHTGINTPKGLALAAMHTEVRLYVEPTTKLFTEQNYDPKDEPQSILLGVAPQWPEEKPPSEGSTKWYQYQLARGGFHPGPINGTRPANPQSPYAIALKEFKKSFPKKAGITSSDYARLTIDDAENGDTKAVLKKLEEDKRPWFGKDTNRDPITAKDGSDIIADKTKKMVVFIDDRQYYTDSGDATTNGHAASLGNPRGAMAIGDNKVTKDAELIPRPWIPLQASLALLGRDQQLDAVIAQASLKDSIQPEAVGPIRVDWTFDDLEADLSAIAVGDYDTGADVNKKHIRTRKWLEWQLDQQKTGDYVRKDMTRTVKFYNCKKDFGGLRPNDDGALNVYYKEPFGVGDDSLIPWRAMEDSAVETVATVVHDDVRPDKSAKSDTEVFYPKTLWGRAGVYFRPSLIAGDGYRLRAQVRFRDTTDYKLPNREVLEKRYPRVPQSTTAELRNWRRMSIRGYVRWTAAATPNWPGLAAAGGFPRHYRAANVHVVHESGSPEAWTAEELLKLSSSSSANAIKNLIKDKVAQAELKHISEMSITTQWVWPWFHRLSLGWQRPAPLGMNRANYYQDWFNPETDEGILSPWRAYRAALLFELVKAVEKKHGIMTGHLMVEFDSTPQWWMQEYECDTCGERRFYIEKTNAGGDANGRVCKNAGGCGGHMRQYRTYTGHYVCDDAAAHPTDKNNDTITGDNFAGAPCPTGGCGGTLVKNGDPTAGPLNVYDGSDSFPLPAVGSSVGATWLFTSGEDVVWTHEVGHHKHFEHSANAPGAVDAQHDAVDNPELRPYQGHYVCNDAAAHGWNYGNDVATGDKYVGRACSSAGCPGTLVQNGPPTAQPYTNKTRWDRDCVMNGYTSGWPRAHDFFCGKCILKLRGWKVQALANPGSAEKDP